MTNEECDQALYRYPDSQTLRNKADIEDAAALADFEAEAVRQRMEEGVPTGNFDLQHLQDIHRHLFQDVYEWAGEIRQVDIAKTSWFLPYDRIEMGMADMHRRLEAADYLKGLDAGQFAKAAGEVMGDVNHVHPFREGNGRTQFQFLKQLGERAGHAIDLERFDRDSWIEASIESHGGSTDKMAACIDKGLVRGIFDRADEIQQENSKTAPDPSRTRTPDREP